MPKMMAAALALVVGAPGVAPAAAMPRLSERFPALQTVQSAYYVYCANGKIEIDGRDPKQMRSARGSDTCMFSQFGYRMDAESFVRKNFGRVGSKCSCR